MRVTLDKPHSHAGKDEAAGAHLDLCAVDAEWLILRGVAHRTTPADLARHANSITPASAGAESPEDPSRAADDADAHAGA